MMYTVGQNMYNDTKLMSKDSSLRKETFLSENRNPAQMKRRGKGILYRNGM